MPKFRVAGAPLDILEQVLSPNLSRLLGFQLTTAELTRLTAVAGGSRHIPALDGIRGYACLAVLIEHCLIGLFNPAFGKFGILAGNYLNMILLAGVDCFFVLSGFLIGGILMDSRAEPHFFKRFWIRRAARILPVLYILLASYAAILFLRSHFDLPQLDLWLLDKPIPPLWTYATFLQSIPIASGGYGGPRWVGITWSLAIEEQCYLFFPVVVYFLSRRSLTAVALSAIVISPFLRDLFERFYGNWYAPYVLLPSRLDGLMFGVLVAIIVRNTRALILATQLRRVLDIIALAIIYVIVTNDPITNFWVLPFKSAGPFPPFIQSLFAILFSIIILRIYTHQNSLFNRMWEWKLLTGVGVISYALYMYHQAINGLVHGFIFHQEPAIKDCAELLAGIIVMILSIALAILSYIYIEKPIRSFAHRSSDRYASMPHQRKHGRQLAEVQSNA
jgi:peptidoglycan/LPS O-acetylase OafA/YrhL